MNRVKMEKFMMRRNMLIILIILLAIISYLSIDTYSQPEKNVQVSIPVKVLPEIEPTPPVSLNITAVGDIMTHGPQLRAQFDGQKGIYRFDNNYNNVKDIIGQADIALCNIETVFAGPEEKYSSYPRFNTPDSLAVALKEAGFDIGVTSNNHCFDRGEIGISRTLSVLRELDMKTVGTQLENEKKYQIINYSDIKIGICAYTYETGDYNGLKTINGLPVQPSIENQINSFSYDTLEDDLKMMKKDIEEMHEEGAELVVFYLHWGQEYRLSPDTYQKSIAEFLAENGVDIIFGSHPHVIQPIEIIETEKGKNTIVFYSLGNFISNQRYEIMNKRHTEDGLIAQVTYEIYPDDKEVVLQSVYAIPTWVHKYFENNKYVYEIEPLPQFIKREDLTENTLWRGQNSLNNTVEIIGEDYFDKESMKFILFDTNDQQAVNTNEEVQDLNNEVRIIN